MLSICNNVGKGQYILIYIFSQYLQIAIQVSTIFGKHTQLSSQKHPIIQTQQWSLSVIHSALKLLYNSVSFSQLHNFSFSTVDEN